MEITTMTTSQCARGLMRMKWPDDGLFLRVESVDTDGEIVLSTIEEVSKPKYRFEKVADSIFDLKDEFERGELYVKARFARDYSLIKDTQTLSQAINHELCFRCIEISERDEFIERAMEITKEQGTEDDSVWMRQLYDAGCRFTE